MITRALVQVQQKSQPEVEAQALIAELPRRGVPVDTFTFKRLSRRQLDLASTTLVAGDLDAMRMAFRYLEVEGPFLSTYPDALSTRLGRRVWTSTVAEVVDHIEHSGAPLFVKPKDDAKRFTGFVAATRADLRHFAGASRRLEVLCSEVLTFEAEFRAYIVDGRVAATARYKGDGDAPASFVDECVRQFADAPRGYALDVANTPTGPVVIECNDGFGLGLYEGVPSTVYADLICARWEELTLSLSE